MDNINDVRFTHINTSIQQLSKDIQQLRANTPISRGNEVSSTNNQTSGMSPVNVNISNGVNTDKSLIDIIDSVTLLVYDLQRSGLVKSNDILAYMLKSINKMNNVENKVNKLMILSITIAIIAIVGFCIVIVKLS